jgi:tRNA(Ile)-lysidine synthase
VKNEFLQHIERKKLFAKTDRLLLGVSGGKDSMALAHMLIEAGYTFSVAHCNFGLRGEEAEGDEAFVKEYFLKKNIEVISTRFPTKEYAEKTNCSIQMAARELRYQWFNDLLAKNGFTYILTAHHANDAIETFFINLLRGSGLNGLKGIPEKSNAVVRPLLFASREQIDAYISENAIPYREDSSNTEEKYLRNKLRKQLLPLLKEINPSLEETMKREMDILLQSHTLLSEAMEGKLRECVHTEKDETSIELKKIRHLEYRELLLHEVLRSFGFNGDVVRQLNESIDTFQPGKQFHSFSHTLLLDRDRIIIRPASGQDADSFFEIPETTSSINDPISLAIHRQDGAVVLDGVYTACIDAKKLDFPLRLTRWKEGDSFQPLGMKGSKKLSDFFIAQKMNIFEKQQQWILRSGTEIVWVLGKRVDERFKVDENTTQTLILNWQV